VPVPTFVTRLFAVCLLNCVLTAQVPTDAIVQRLAHAHEQLIAGNLTQAQSILTNLVRSHPKDARVHNLLGALKAQQGAFDLAEKHLTEAVRLTPRYTDAYLNLGRLYQENLGKDPKNLEKAIEVYRRVLTYEPARTEALYQLGLLFHLKQENRLSLKYLQELAPGDRLRPQALSLLCADYAALGNQQQADDAANTLVSRMEFTEEDVTVIIPTLRKANRSDLAIRLLQALSGKGPLSVKATESLAFLVAEQGDIKRGIALLDSLADRHSSLPGLLLQEASLAYSGGLYEQTLGYLAHARDLSPDDARIHLFFGITCMNLGLGMEAIQSFEKALALAPGNAYCHFALGVGILHWQEASKAIPHLEKYCQIRPDDQTGKAALAEAHFLDKDYEAAKQGFLKLVAEPDNKATALYYLGAIARLENSLEEAAGYLQQVLAIEPRHPGALAELGWIQTRKGQFQEAEAGLQKALEADPDHYQGNYNLLLLYARTRNPRLEAQKAAFEKIKQKRWETLTAALRKIEAVPRAGSAGLLDK